MAVEIERLVTRFETDISDVRRDMTRMRKGTRDATEDMGRRFSSVGSRISGAFAGAAAAIGISTGISGLLALNIQFEQLEARLRTLFRGDAAKATEKFNELADVAAELPFSIDQTVDAFARLGLLGLRPSTDAIRSFANIAAAVGTRGAQSLQQVVEAVADATTFEFEQLKELGIIARKDGDKINVTLRGVTREVKANAESVAGFFETLGTTEFAGAAEERMKGLEGSISNLGDAFKRASKLIGESGFNKAITDAANAIAPAVVPGTQVLVNALDSIVNAAKDVATIPLDVWDRINSAVGTDASTRPTTAAPMTGSIIGTARDIRGQGSIPGAGRTKFEEMNSTKQLRVLQSIDRRIFTNLETGAVMG